MVAARIVQASVNPKYAFAFVVGQAEPAAGKSRPKRVSAKVVLVKLMGCQLGWPVGVGDTGGRPTGSSAQVAMVTLTGCQLGLSVGQAAPAEGGG